MYIVCFQHCEGRKGHQHSTCRHCEGRKGHQHSTCRIWKNGIGQWMKVRQHHWSQHPSNKLLSLPIRPHLVSHMSSITTHESLALGNPTAKGASCWFQGLFRFFGVHFRVSPRPPEIETQQIRILSVNNPGIHAMPRSEPSACTASKDPWTSGAVWERLVDLVEVMILLSLLYWLVNRFPIMRYIMVV